MNSRELVESLSEDEMHDLMLDWNRLEFGHDLSEDSLLRKKARQLGNDRLLQMYNLMFEVYRRVSHYHYGL